MFKGFIYILTPGDQDFVSCIAVIGEIVIGTACAKASGDNSLTSTVTFADTADCCHTLSLTEKVRWYLQENKKVRSKINCCLNCTVLAISDIHTFRGLRQS